MVYIAALVFKEKLPKIRGHVGGFIYLVIPTYVVLRALVPRTQLNVMGSLTFHYGSVIVIGIGLIATVWLLLRVLKVKLKIPGKAIGMISNSLAFILVGLVSITFLLDRLFAEKVEALLNRTTARTEQSQGLYLGLFIIAGLFIAAFFSKFKIKMLIPILPKFKETQFPVQKKPKFLRKITRFKAFAPAGMFTFLLAAVVYFLYHEVIFAGWLLWVVLIALFFLMTFFWLIFNARKAEEENKKKQPFFVLTMSFLYAFVLEAVIILGIGYQSGAFGIATFITAGLLAIFAIIAKFQQKKEETGTSLKDQSKDSLVVQVHEEEDEL